MNDLREAVAFAIEQAMPTRALGVLYAGQQSDCGPLADAAIAAVLDHLTAEAGTVETDLYAAPYTDPMRLADWLRSIREAGQ